MSSTPEQRAAWREAARREAARRRRTAKLAVPRRIKDNHGGAQHDAIVYLRHAEREINRELRAGEVKKLGKAALLTLLALSVLVE